MKAYIRISYNGKSFEGEATLSEMRSGHLPATKQVTGSKVSKTTKPSGVVDKLYSEGFFTSSQTLGAVVTQLGHEGYNFSAPSILMSLKSREYLQRRGSKGSYRFVQKYPAGGA
jgi:hypothetical protein